MKNTKKKIKILHLVQSLGVGGAEILLLNYIKAFGTTRYKHFVYCFELSGPLKSEIEKLGIHVRIGPYRDSIKKPVKFILSIVILICDLCKFIKNRRINIIQSHLGHANQLGTIVGKILGIPAFPTVHNTMAFEDERRKRDLRIYVIRVVDEIVYRIADKVIAVSDEIKEIIMKTFRLDDSKILVLKNGIIWDKDTIKPAKLEPEFHLKPDTTILISVGSLTYQKAYDVLIRAIANLTKEGYDNILVLIVGEGEERLGLESLIQEMKLERWIKLLGLKKNVISLLKASDIFVMPSRYEGLSIAMIEAMACGLPIVASDAPGLNIYIKNNKSGLLFPVGDYKALSQCIKQVLTNKTLQKNFSYEVKNYFKKEFDLHHNIQPFELLIQKCLAKRS